MIHNLPPEVTQIIIDQLLIYSVGHPFDDDRNVPEYICLQAWNMVVEPKDLLNLACTSRYFKQTIYSNIYKYLARNKQKEPESPTPEKPKETPQDLSEIPDYNKSAATYFLPVNLPAEGQDDFFEIFGLF